MSAENTSEEVDRFFEQFRQDCGRGVVQIEGEGFKKKSLSWQEIADLENQLRANTALQARVMSLQGLGEFVGFQVEEGVRKLVLVDRGPKPVVYAHVGPHLISITTDTPNREALLAEVEGLMNPPLGEALLSINSAIVEPNHKTMMWAMVKGGFTLPVETRLVGDLRTYKPQGLVAAVEAVTGQPFVQKPSEARFAQALLGFNGNPGERDRIPVVNFAKTRGTTIMSGDRVNPSSGQARRFVIG